MSYISITSPLRAENGQATGASDNYLPNVNVEYGPHNSLDSAKNALSSAYDGYIPLGVTVAVRELGKLVEYWNPEVSNLFIKKQSSSSGAESSNSSVLPINVTNTKFSTSGQLNAKYPNALPGAIVTYHATDKSGDAAIYIKVTPGDQGQWLLTNGFLLDLDAAPTIASIVNAHVLSVK